MLSPARNPYAPPGALASPSAPGPLPPGAVRYTLNADRYRALVRARMLRVYGVLGVGLAGSAYWLHDKMEGTVFGGWLLLVVVLLAIALVRTRRLNARAFETYELLVGPRVIRRTVAGVTAAEVLSLEVTGAFETRWGVWLTCERARSSLFVSRAVEGYDALCGLLRERWHTIEPVSGWPAWRLASKASVQQRSADETSGAALTADLTLAHEVEELRLASSQAWMAFPRVAPARRRRTLRIVLALYAVIAVFLFLFSQLAAR